MPACVRPVGYMPRQTQECDAAVLVRRHLAEFLERCDERAGPLPEFVKGELEGFAGCGDFELGFVRTCCRTCGDELRVPFACKSRGFCPSCMTRALGLREFVEVDILVVPVQIGDRLLLCSDGLHAYLDAGPTLSDLFKLDVREAARAAIRHANACGGADNITALFVEFLASS